MKRNLFAMPMAPAVLRSRPLRFGDEEQIAALRLYSSAVAEVEARVEAFEKGELQEFLMGVSFSGTFCLNVLATDRQDAIERAKEEVESLDTSDFWPELDDFDCRVVGGGAGVAPRRLLAFS